MKYDFSAIEKHWQSRWAEHKAFAAANPGEDGFDPDKPKFYVLDMFPYPSGVGLHVGHPLGYIATDIVSRYKRMRGHNVLHPMGFDAFGLPAEQFAVEHNVHPRVTTEKNIGNMVAQLKQLGLSYDWDRCFATTDVSYYKWTQWVFLQVYNSWFDPIDLRAKPIAELEQLLQSGEYDLGPDDELIPVSASGGLDPIGGPPVGARKWHELSPQEKQRVLDGYRLAYTDEVPVNWCPALGTVLANEEVTADGKSERGNHPVYKRDLRQWLMRITAYADRLIDDLELVDWPESTKQMQRNWIGKSRGARVDFETHRPDRPDEPELITVFTTRPDTLFGATYMVLAPEHPLLSDLTTSEHFEAVDAYRRAAEGRSEIDRQAETKQKTGVFTGSYAINPANGEKIPVWVADYVLMGYGTGAIMAVPAHDDRDFAFARQFDLPIRAVVMPDDAWLTRHAEKGESLEDARARYLAQPSAFPEAFVGQGEAINSGNEGVTLDGYDTADAKAAMTDWLEREGVGRAQVQYKLRDWLFSRQRYWGEPFPILHGPEGQVVGVDESDLPVELPPMEDFKPRATDDPDAPPQPPLSRAPEDWQYVTRGGKRYRRELNTMPQWAGSCWYYLRFCDAKNDERFAGEAAENYWMQREQDYVTEGHESHGSRLAQAPAGGVDLYVGGVEHAVLHLLYARFWHKVLYDLGYVSTPEPFGRLYNQGYIQAYAYTDARGVYVPAEEVEERDGQYFYKGEPVTREFGKMGKSLKNAIAPDEVCRDYGADTLRLYEMYMGPLDQSKVWNTRDIVGVHRFLQRVWRNFIDEDTGKLLVLDTAPSDEVARLTHQTIKRVTDDMERLSFNTAIAALIELNNELVKLEALPRSVAEPFVQMLAPLAPHMAEELWHRLGHEGFVSLAGWPEYDPQKLVASTVEYPVQVNGKLRSRITVAADADQQQIQDAALADEKIQAAMEGKQLRKAIVIKDKLVNLVVG